MALAVIYLSFTHSFNLMIVPFLGKDLAQSFWKEERAPSSLRGKSQKTGGHQVRTCPTALHVMSPHRKTQYLLLKSAAS